MTKNIKKEFYHNYNDPIGDMQEARSLESSNVIKKLFNMVERNSIISDKRRGDLKIRIERLKNNLEGVDLL